MPDRRNWYYSKDKQRQGPMSEAVMAALIAGGVVMPDTYVWTKSAGAWVRMGDTDLARYLSEREAPLSDVDAVPPAPDEEDAPQPTGEPQAEEPAPKPARKRAAQKRTSKKSPAADEENALQPAEAPEEDPAPKPAKKRASRKPRAPKALPLDEASPPPPEAGEAPLAAEPETPPLDEESPPLDEIEGDLPKQEQDLDDDVPPPDVMEETPPLDVDIPPLVDEIEDDLPNAAQDLDDGIPPLDSEEEDAPEVPSPEPPDEPPTFDEPETPPPLDADSPTLDEIEDNPPEAAQGADDDIPPLSGVEETLPLDEDSPALDEIGDNPPEATQGADDDIPSLDGEDEVLPEVPSPESSDEPPTPGEPEPPPSFDEETPPLEDIEDDQSRLAQDMDDGFPPLGRAEESPAAASPPGPPAPKPVQSGAKAESPLKPLPKEKKRWKSGLRKRTALFAALLIVGMSALAFAVYRFGLSRDALPGEEEIARAATASDDLTAAPSPPDGAVSAEGMGAPSLPGATDDGSAGGEAATAQAPPRRPDLSGIPPDFELVRAYVTGENVSIRKTPSMAGTIAYRVGEGEAHFIVARSMIADGSDGSGWYGIVCLSRVLGYDYYLREPLYVSSRSVKTVPLEREDREKLAWLRKGRPPLFNTGDEFPDVFEVESFYDVFEITEPVTVRRFPDRNAESITLRRGTRIFNLLPPSGYFPGEHVDMDNERWRPVVGGDKKVLGWIGPGDGAYPGTPSG